MNSKIKTSYICRDIRYFDIDEKLAETHIPKAGDAAIFKVLSIGKHSTIQAADKLNWNIYPEDYIMAAFGTRYATSQFEGYIPSTPKDRYHILGAGGTVGIVKTMHEKFCSVGPTGLAMVGYAVDQKGAILNTKWIKSKKIKTFDSGKKHRAKIILSVGSSMDSGKTTTAAYLIRGLSRKNFKTAFIKLTGTVYTKDKDFNYYNGADKVADFGDLGFPSTYLCSEKELLNLYESLLSEVGANECDFIVVEIADGIYQRETEMLLTNKDFMATVDAVVFSACDSLAAIQGVNALQQMQIIPSALSGLFTASPLLINETKCKTDIRILTINELAEGAFLEFLKPKKELSNNTAGQIRVLA